MSEVSRFTAMMQRSAALKARIATELAAAVIGVVDACERAVSAEGKLMFCGNGGSAADRGLRLVLLRDGLHGRTRATSAARVSRPTATIALNPKAPNSPHATSPGGSDHDMFETSEFQDERIWREG